ncbi:MAG TPA: BrxA/BrxB family bacilliredoxin [Patescibacteria group bacterium]|nr:BrxA/BrxB family bacilliredoxin [Patescibacteria group bacterium]
MPYDPMLVQPMKDELTAVGFEQLETPEEVDAALNRKGTTLVVINSVCGCAAGSARPAVKAAVRHSVKPDHLVTVFAGQDVEAVQRVREQYLKDQPPSSPSIALMKDGELIAMVHRHQIESYPAQAITDALTGAFEKFCADEQNAA